MIAKNLTAACALTLGLTIGAAHAQQGPPDGAPGQRGDGGPAARLLSSLDGNGDGLVTIDEFTQAHLDRAFARFAARDANGDALLTSDEVGGQGDGLSDERIALAQCVAERLGLPEPEPQSPDERFAAADINGDGAIDASEVEVNATERALARFERIDANADGTISAAELRPGLRRQAELRRARRDCRDEIDDASALLAG